MTHPVTGLPSRLKWLPAVSEVRMACDDAMEPLIRMKQHTERMAQQLADREAIERERSKPRPTLDDLKAKYGDDWGILAAQAKQKTVEPAPNVDQLRHHYAHYDLAFRPKQSEEDFR